MVKLSDAQLAALRVLADDREHATWKRSTDPAAYRGAGRVNARVAGSLSHFDPQLARITGASPGRVRITRAGLETLGVHDQAST